ncbi:DUF6161 domain-containing protein [Roseibium sp. TrichSKD4]|uniref:DUF6161 domain-containing protein n=1 Tax=Roseibium sp. TrichSKD4 TaxID=744980 RepID=UPI0002F9D7A7|nr:DUF6161 domain-containing protein [Roseibium sp. TrichSKD4]
MPNKNTQILLDLGVNNGKKTFGAWEEVQAFLESEVSAYRWLKDHQTHCDIFSNIHRYQVQINQQQDKARAAHLVGELFKTFGLPLSNSVQGAFISQLRKDYSDAVAAGALSQIMGLRVQNPDAKHFKGIVLGIAFQEGFSVGSATATQNALTELEKDFRVKFDETEVERRKQSGNFKRQRTLHKRLVRKAMLIAEKQAALLNKQVVDATNEAIASLQNTEATYREHMKLRAPVEYWRQKSTAHSQKSGTYRLFLFWYFLIATTLVGGGLFGLAKYMIGIATPTTPTPVYFILGTMGVLGTTIYFWIARIMAKLFLSEHHMSIDAEERAVMAETYLALIENNEAQDKEREIVLASLFRPTSVLFDYQI